MSKIRVLVDSPGDLSLEEAQEHNVLVIPVKLTFDGETLYRDKYDIDAQTFYKMERQFGTEKMPKTMQITPIEFEELFREQAREYDELIVLTLGSPTSGTFQSAMNAKRAVEEDLPVKIHMIESMHLSFGYGYVAAEAGKLAEQGKSAEEVVAYINSMLPRLHTYFTVESLDYLKKGGRIKTATAIIGGMLDIRPILQVKDGLVSAVDKVRGEKKVVPKYLSLLKELMEQSPNGMLVILHTDNLEKAEQFGQTIEAQLGRKVDRIVEAGPVIGAHSGPGVLGFCYIAQN